MAAFYMFQLSIGGESFLYDYLYDSVLVQVHMYLSV